MQPYYNRREDVRPPTTKTSSNYKSNPAPKRRGRRRLFFIGLFATIFLTWASSLWMDQKVLLAEKQQELNEMKVKVKEASKVQSELTYQMKRLEDNEYIEEVARRDYFLSRPGEILFQVPNE